MLVQYFGAELWSLCMNVIKTTFEIPLFMNLILFSMAMWHTHACMYIFVCVYFAFVVCVSVRVQVLLPAQIVTCV